MKKTLLYYVLLMLLSTSTQAITLTDNAGLVLQMGTNGTVSSVSLNKTTLPAAGIGGFYSQIPNTTTKVAFTGTATTAGGITQLKLTNSLQDSVTATITQGVGYIEVSGVLKDLTGTDRGLWLGFNLPVNTIGWKWGHNLTGTTQVISSTAPGYSGYDRLLVPIPAVWSTNGGIALSIPPSNPCVFENSADASGLRIQMAFGLSPITAQFPSKAAFCFRIYTIDGTWGFRDALAKYYDWYPDYYNNEPQAIKRLNHSRDWLTQNFEDEGPSSNDLAALAFPGRGQYCAYTKTTARPSSMTGADLTTVLPTNTQAYLDAIATSTYIMHYSRKGPIDNPALVEGREAISNCVAYHPDGSWSMEDAVGTGSLDIGHNVSPYLFKDAAHPNWPIYGDLYLRRPSKLIAFEPKYTFMHWDRLGGRSTLVNYRREHFTYTHTPLTFDQLGRICLPSLFTNYELFDAFRLQEKQGGMYHEGAGMEAFGVKSKTEMSGGQDRVSLFFLSAVLASAWNEGGEKSHALGEYDLQRIYMGRKAYRIACERNQIDTVKRALSNAIAYGYVSVLGDSYFSQTTESSFYTPEHQAVWTNYIPTSEAIRLAGWEPVTYATTTSTQVELQRFGRGDSIYITAWGPTPPASIDIEIDSLGLGFQTKPAFTEMLSNTTMTITKSTKGWTLTVPMVAGMARVIRMVSPKLTSLETNSEDARKFEVYPNPNHGIINIQCKRANELHYSLKITNPLNQELYTASLNADKTTLDISQFTGKGVVFVQIFDSKGSSIGTKKIIVQ